MALNPAQQEQFDKCLAFVLEQEGGFSDDPTDHGGRTNLGIEETEYNAWRHEQGLQGDISVADITHEQAAAIYLTKYWLPVHCGLLEYPANLALFDSVVNTGLRQGVKFLQRSIGTTADGAMGPVTMASMVQVVATNLRDRICDKREMFYRELATHPGQGVFLRDWLNRVAALRNA